MTEKIKSFKGFDKNWKCRDFQYKVGETYTHDGAVKACESGFHACEYPLDVFGYYPPASSKFAEVEQSGEVGRDGGDSKIASKSISISAEISIAGLVKAAIGYTTSRCGPINPESPASATGYQGAASATGYSGRVMGSDGNALFAVERDDDYNIISVACGIAGQGNVKADIWYVCKGGELVEL